MGTFGTGPFGSDGALDLLDELSERAPADRHAALRHMFEFVRDNPGLLWKEFFPDEVVAAAAIVAASFPGADDFRDALLDELDNDSWGPDDLLTDSADDLAGPALDALLFVAGPGGSWHDGWVDADDAAEARATADDLVARLRARTTAPA